KGAEPDEPDFVAALQGIADHIEHGLDSTRCPGPAEAGRIRDLHDEILLVHPSLTPALETRGGLTHETPIKCPVRGRSQKERGRIPPLTRACSRAWISGGPKVPPCRR